MQNIILMSVLLFIFIIVSFKEKYKFSSIITNNNGNSNGNGKECSIKEDPCFLYENVNRTQLIYIKLLNALNKISNKDKRTLGSDCKQHVFIQGTSDNRLKTEIDEITKIILDKINSITGFYFQKIYNDTITVFEDCKGNRNFIYNVFVYDSNEELKIRLQINVIKYIINCPKREKEITCATATTPGMDSFEIGYPQPEQLLPLPTEVIVTSGAPDLLSVKGINIKKIPPIKSLYINEVKIYNTNAVINADGKCLMQPVCGNIKETTLDSSPFNQPTSPFVEPSCVANQWIRLLNEPENTVAWPAGEASQYWDKKGVPISVTCNSKMTGIRSSTVQYPMEAQFWRNNYGLPKWSGVYADLFKLTRGQPVFSAHYTN